MATAAVGTPLLGVGYETRAFRFAPRIWRRTAMAVTGAFGTEPCYVAAPVASETLPYLRVWVVASTVERLDCPDQTVSAKLLCGLDVAAPQHCSERGVRRHPGDDSYDIGSVIFLCLSTGMLNCRAQLLPRSPT